MFGSPLNMKEIKMTLSNFIPRTLLLLLIVGLISCGEEEMNDPMESDLPDYIPTTGYTTPTSYNGMTLIWQDEFNENSLNTSIWNYETGDGCDKGICGWGNNELQWYTGNNARIEENEYLVITALKQDSNGKEYTSSRISTEDKFEFKYGRVDIRAALPEGKGLWPALWMLGTSGGQWPKNGEIDIMESGQGGDDDKVVGTVHWDSNGSNANYGQSKSFPNGNLQNQFHVFSIEWSANVIRWYVDDVEYNVINTSPSDLSEFRNDFYLLLNVAVGGDFSGNPDSSTSFPQRMVVDYVRVFQ